MFFVRSMGPLDFLIGEAILHGRAASLPGQTLENCEVLWPQGVSSFSKEAVPHQILLHFNVSAVKQRGRENKGPPDISPKSFS